MRRVDLNCDMGEGYANDVALMRYVSSVNIACGYHAGDAETVRRTADSAVENGCAIGAHPGYQDRENFGRTAVTLSAREIYDLVTEQLEIFRGATGATLNHVKPHGALYNHSAGNVEIAAAIAESVRDFDENLVLFGLSGSVSITEAKRLGLQTASEVFADRTYTRDGSLTPRSEPNALISNANEAVAQVLSMIDRGSVTATDGSLVPIIAETVCIHGDGQHAVDFASIIYRELTEMGIDIRPTYD